MTEAEAKEIYERHVERGPSRIIKATLLGIFAAFIGIFFMNASMFAFVIASTGIILVFCSDDMYKTFLSVIAESVGISTGDSLFWGTVSKKFLDSRDSFSAPIAASWIGMFFLYIIEAPLWSIIAVFTVFAILFFIRIKIKEK